MYVQRAVFSNVVTAHRARRVQMIAHACDVMVAYRVRRDEMDTVAICNDTGVGGDVQSGVVARAEFV